MFAAAFLGLTALSPAAPVPPAPPPNPTGKAFLGVQSVDTHSLVVGQVIPDMPAARAGIRTGDRVVRVGAVEPASFEQLSAHVQTYRPGATIEVEVERDGRRQTFRVRLTTRPADADLGRGPFPGFPND